MNHLVITVLFIFCSNFSWAQKSKSLEDNASKLTAELQKIAKKKDINGFGVAVVNDQQILYAQGFGYANTTNKVSYSRNTLQNIGSVSKTLIGVALLKAVEDGYLQLDDPINNYLPFEINNPYRPSKRITIRHLATHTSTITDTKYYDQRAYVLANAADGNLPVLQTQTEVFQHPEQKESLESFIRKLLTIDGAWYATNNFLNTVPGSTFEYSNVGAAIAAYVLEQAVDMTYQEYTKLHIFKPLQMTATGWTFEEVDMTQHSLLYASNQSPLPFYSLVTYPDGGLLTNIEDLSKYLIELINGQNGQGKLLKKSSYQEIFTAQLTPDQIPGHDAKNPYNDEFNSGIFMGFTPVNSFGHTGSDPGIASYIFFDPITKLGRILLLNTSLNTKESVKQYFSISKALEKYVAAYPQTTSE